jgi:hypothetical protein
MMLDLILGKGSNVRAAWKDWNDKFPSRRFSRQVFIGVWKEHEGGGNKEKKARGRRPVCPSELYAQLINTTVRKSLLGVPLTIPSYQPFVVKEIEEYEEKKGVKILGVNKFSAGRNWMSRLLRVSDLSFKRMINDSYGLPEDWEQTKREFEQRVGRSKVLYDIESDVTINIDQTALILTPVGNYSWSGAGEKAVAFKGNKQQITATLAIYADGTFGEVQLIFKGKTAQVHPETAYEGIIYDHSHNHWASLATMQRLVKDSLAPELCRRILKKDPSFDPNECTDKKAMLLLDSWSVHRSKEFREYMDRYFPWILLVYIPPRCTSKCQPLDVAVNYQFKNIIRQGFERQQHEIADEVLAAAGEGPGAAARAAELMRKRIKETMAAKQARAGLAELVNKAAEMMREDREAVKTAFIKAGLGDLTSNVVPQAQVRPL